jgi:LmbE family N-acetylglucosaminyl deacetylase
MLLAILLATLRVRAVTPHVSELASARSVLFVAAHPDDEVPIAPWLAKKCIEERARCSILVLTSGENGGNAAVRAAEMGQSASLFGAQLTMWGLVDGAPASWGADIGQRIRTHIEAIDPDIVVTFDPRHGTTGHPDHRAVGQLVIDAIGGTRPLYLIETRIDVFLSPFSITLSAAEPPPARYVERFDAESRWDVLLEVMAIHRSQFDELWIGEVAESPLRAVFFASVP